MNEELNNYIIMSSYTKEIGNKIKQQARYMDLMKENAKELINLIKQHPNCVQNKDKSIYYCPINYCRDCNHVLSYCYLWS